MRKLLIAATFSLFAAASLTAEQPEVKPGPEHAFLKEGEGIWDATVKAKGKESKGTLSCKGAVNGLWVLEHYQGEASGVAFEGYGATTFDPAKKKFINVWIDSMATTPMLSEGTYDKDKKTLTLLGNLPTPDGKPMKASITIAYKDANTKVLTLKGNLNGKDLEIVEITYKRRAASTNKR